MYELQDVTANSPWKPVGERQFFDCDKHEFGSFPARVSGLAPGHTHRFRIYATYSLNGQSGSARFDADGTKNGTHYDQFTTPDVTQVAELPPETYWATDSDGSAIAASCKIKEITNIRKGSSTLGTHLWTVRLTTAWKYCNGWDIVRMYPASAECNLTTAGTLAGWSCGDITKIRAVNYGGNPEHAAYSYSYQLHWESPIYGALFQQNKRWCATNQISGSGAHKRTGSCDVQPW